MAANASQTLLVTYIAADVGHNLNQGAGAGAGAVSQMVAAILLSVLQLSQGVFCRMYTKVDEKKGTTRKRDGAGHADERLEVRRPRPGVAGERPPHSILDCGVLYGIVAGTISLDYSQHVLVCTYNIPY